MVPKDANSSVVASLGLNLSRSSSRARSSSACAKAPKSRSRRAGSAASPKSRNSSPSLRQTIWVTPDAEAAVTEGVAAAAGCVAESDREAANRSWPGAMHRALNEQLSTAAMEEAALTGELAPAPPVGEPQWAEPQRDAFWETPKPGLLGVEPGLPLQLLERLSCSGDDGGACREGRRPSVPALWARCRGEAGGGASKVPPVADDRLTRRPHGA